MKGEESMDHKKGISGYLLMSLAILLLGMIGWFWLSYNTLVAKEEQVKTAWSQVESNIQRKIDLLPNLVKVVKRYAAHEKEVYTQIATLRAKAGKALQAPQDDVTKAKEIAAVQKQLNAATTRLFAVAENYPQLRSSEQFLQLQSQIEGAENRINITRMQFNEAVGDFNAYLRHIPANIVTSLGGFKPKAYFKADEAAHKKLTLEI